MALKEKYSALQKKYSLPDYSELNRDFDIEDISEDSERILQKIRGKITEKLETYVGLLESFVQPDTNLKDMYEAKHIEDNARENAYLLFKKLMGIVRHSNLVALNNSDEENAKFIKEAYSEWQNLKNKIEPHIAKLREVWKKETNIKSDLSYFG